MGEAKKGSDYIAEYGEIVPFYLSWHYYATQVTLCTEIQHILHMNKRSLNSNRTRLKKKSNQIINPYGSVLITITKS